MTDSPFSNLLKRYRAPVDFEVFLGGGEAFVFKGISSRTEFAKLRSSVDEQIGSIRKTAIEQFRPYLDESDETWRQAFMMQATMIGWHEKSEVARKDGKKYDPQKDKPQDLKRVSTGERLVAFTQLDMMMMAAEAGPTFYDFYIDWEMGQYGALQQSAEDSVEDAKND